MAAGTFVLLKQLDAACISKIHKMKHLWTSFAYFYSLNKKKSQNHYHIFTQNNFFKQLVFTCPFHLKPITATVVSLVNKNTNFWKNFIRCRNCGQHTFLNSNIHARNIQMINVWLICSLFRWTVLNIFLKMDFHLWKYLKYYELKYLSEWAKYCMIISLKGCTA